MFNISSLLNKLPDLHITDFELTRDFLGFLRGSDLKLIGQGGFGSVYSTSDQQKIVKVTSPCEGDKVTVLCDLIRDPEPILDTPHSSKVISISPNYLSEGVVGGILNSLKRYTPHFAEIDGIYSSYVEQRSYLVEDRYNTDLYRQISDLADVYEMLFQVAQGLSVAQEVYRFTHYDLHGDNLLYQEKSGEITYPLVLETGVISVVLNSKFRIKITDFGLSRLESDGYIINPRVDRAPIYSRGIFNPYYDMMALIGWLFNENNLLSEAVKRVMPIQERNRLLGYVFGEDLGSGEGSEEDSGEDWYNRIRRKYYYVKRSGRIKWRPKDQLSIKYVETKNIYQILAWLADRLVESGRMRVGRSGEEILPLRSYDMIRNMKYRRGVDISKENSKVVNQVRDGIRVESYFRQLNYPIPDYTWTPTNDQVRNNPIQDQYVHIAYIDPGKVRIKLDCCKLDPMLYLENRFGLTINGNYYDFKNTDLPIGPYRSLSDNRYFESNLSIDHRYYGYYGYIGISGNKIDIGKDLKAEEYDYLVASGPILVEDGKIKFDRELMYKREGGVAIFQCAKGREGSRAGTDGVISNVRGRGGKVGKNIPACKDIQPGQLAHAGNPNPRSMIVKRRMTLPW